MDEAHKYVITFCEGPRPVELKLEKYYVGEQEPTDAHTEADAGLWFLMRQSELFHTNYGDNHTAGISGQAPPRKQLSLLVSTLLDRNLITVHHIDRGAFRTPRVQGQTTMTSD